MSIAIEPELLLGVAQPHQQDVCAGAVDLVQNGLVIRGEVRQGGALGMNERRRGAGNFQLRIRCLQRRGRRRRNALPAAEQE